MKLEAEATKDRKVYKLGTTLEYNFIRTGKKVYCGLKLLLVVWDAPTTKSPYLRMLQSYGICLDIINDEVCKDYSY